MAIRSLFALLLVFALCAPLALAQVNSATISGTVRDASGAVLPGVSVAIQNQDTGISRTVITNETGRYTAPALGLGSYQVTAQLQGFQSQVHSGLALTVGREAVVDFTLSVGTVAQTVEVKGEAPLVELTNANMGGLVDDRTIREMPLNSRSWDTLAYMVPGVVKYGTANADFNSGSGANKFSVAGSRSYSNSFLLDGTDVNDSSNSTPGGSAGTNLGVDAIKEFKIVATTFSAEYGRASGAVVSAVTRSGTNELHGSLFEFLRNSAFDARTIFDLNDRDGDGKADLPPFRRNQFGGVLGGPIQKDRTFFFGAYEGFRQARSDTTIAVVPTAAAKLGILPCAPPANRVAGSEAARLCPGSPINSSGSYGTYTVTPNPKIVPYLQYYPDPNGQIFKNRTTGDDLYIGEFVGAPNNVIRQDFFMGRVDHQLTPSTNLFGRYQFDDDSNTAPKVQGNIDVQTRARRQYATLQSNTVFKPTLLNAVRFAFNRSAQFQDAIASTDLAKTLTFVPGQIMGTMTVGEERGTPTIGDVGSDTNYPRFWVYNLWEFGDDLTWVNGAHNFKFGGVVKRIQNNNTVQSEVRGQYTFQNIEDLVLGKPQLFGGVPIGEQGYKGIRQTMLGFYAQDDFKMSSRFTLNLGLRWETTTDPKDSNLQISNLLDIHDSKETVYPAIHAFFKTLDKNFQPRIGFAWQMNKSASRVMRAGFGIYHDLVVPFAFNQQTSKYPPFYHRLRVRDTTALAQTFPNIAPLLTLSNLAAVQMEPIWPTMPAATKYNYSLAIQQQLGQRSMLEISYVGSQGRHLTRYIQLNYPNYEIVNGQKWYPARISAGLNTTAANCFGPSPAAACTSLNINRRNLNWDRIRTKTNDSNSHYDGLQVKAIRQGGSGVTFTAAYTFSKVMDQQGGLNMNDNGQRDPTTSLDPDDSAREWGRAAHDATHVFSSSVTYSLPFRFTSRAASALLAGWEISGTSLAMSGQPLTPQLMFDYSRTGNSGAADRPDLVPGRSLNPTHGIGTNGTKLGTPEHWFDPYAFALPNPLGLSTPVPGFLGNVGRNTIIGPSLVNFDAALLKRFNLKENTNLTFRAEFFNVLNHTNLGQPNLQPILQDGSYNDAGGRITTTSTHNREIQFGLKLVF
jgi:Carboxypeptidase regulatory-like domain/TonB dependent receptor/TonB-dependent Receptor Plug Domain